MTMTSSLKYNGWFILWCIICILILMKVYHTKDLKTSAGKEILEEHYKSLGHITGKEKRGIILVLILLVYLCSTRITGLPAAYGFMVISVLVFLPGIGIGSEGTVKKINFTTVFFVSSCLEIGKMCIRDRYRRTGTNLRSNAGCIVGTGRIFMDYIRYNLCRWCT